jgi:hypothetical protein
MRPRSLVALIVAAVVAVAAMVALTRPFDGSPAGQRAETSRDASEETVDAPGEEAEGRGGAAELAEQAEITAERLEAYEAARAAGGFRAGVRVTTRPAPGWLGEQVIDPTVDDWEPAIAADPNEPYAYVLTTRYGQPKPCPGNCPTPYIHLSVSSDGGRTWEARGPLCACKGSGQYDPIIEVVPDTGRVYAVFMNGYNVVFVRSNDHGATWSAPVPTYGNVSWNDKPVLATSDDGRDVYVSWNGPQGGDPWVARSRDGGRTWTQTRVANSKRYYFAYDADVLSDGTVVISEGSITYTGPGGDPEGEVRQHALISRDRGATWTDVVVDEVAVGAPCADCRADYYIGHSGVSADARGALTFVYDGATKEFGLQRIYVRTSSDGGRTWSARTTLSPADEMATAPVVESTGRGDVRMWFQQTTGADLDTWNTYYRRSTDGGRTWSAKVRISDAVSGAPYKDADGYDEIYGDYGEIAIASDGATLAAWGEGLSYIGPGGVWVNRGL